MVNKIFVNLPVDNVSATMDFFSKLGFSFNEKFTDEKGACMMVGENIFVMFLTNDFFQTFTKKERTDTTKAIEVITALSLESKEEVDELLERALAVGAEEVNEAQDHDFMYSRSFEDLDGHIWEVFFMDESAAKENVE